MADNTIFPDLDFAALIRLDLTEPPNMTVRPDNYLSISIHENPLTIELKALVYLVFFPISFINHFLVKLFKYKKDVTKHRFQNFFHLLTSFRALIFITNSKLINFSRFGKRCLSWYHCEFLIF